MFAPERLSRVYDIRNYPTSPVIWSAPVLLVPSRCRKRINVYEWTRSAWARGSEIADPTEATEVDADPDLDSDSQIHAYPYRPDDPRREDSKDASAPRAVRSVGFVDSDESMRVAYRLGSKPGSLDMYTGFRVAVCAPRLELRSLPQRQSRVGLG